MDIWTSAERERSNGPIPPVLPTEPEAIFVVGASRSGTTNEAAADGSAPRVGERAGAG